MRVSHTSRRLSPLSSDLVRLEIGIFIERPALTVPYWIDLPDSLAPASPTGNALALLMLPLAVSFGEDMHLDAAVDDELHENLHGVQQIWRSWYPDLTLVALRAPRRPAAPASRSLATIASFSGGIDSFFSLLRHERQITHLLSVTGFNTPLSDFDAMRRVLSGASHASGKVHVAAVTGARYDSAAATPYSVGDQMNAFAHGCLLASIVHLMDAHCGTYIIPASHSYADLMPYGSHPLTDPLFSSSTLRVVHDGAAFGRFERTARVAGSDLALSVLHVCFSDFRAGNCSKCQKCLRTMAALDILDAKDRAKSFDWSGYSMERLGATWLPTQNERSYFVEVAEQARARGREDVARAAERAVATSRRRARLIDSVQSVKTPVIRAIKSNPLTARGWEALRRARRAWPGS